MFRSIEVSRVIRAAKFPAKVVSLATLIAVMTGHESAAQAPMTNEELIEFGRDLFFNETFGGNGRTCGTCHRAEDNFTISPAFIATLPQDDPLFIAENDPNLATLENPRLLREFAAIVENTNGFGDLENDFTMRGIPHVLGMRNTVDSDMGPALGWSGDGSPRNGSLRAFAVGAVRQHFTRDLRRRRGIDFRVPTGLELRALEAFQLSLGRQEEIQLPLPLTGVVAARGQEIFLNNGVGNDDAAGKCNNCHFNAGANINPAISPTGGNRNFNTGVEDLVDQALDLTGELVPPDDGLGVPGDGTFNTPSLIEAADTPPFFHNNAIDTIEGAVAFYNSDAFNTSPSGVVVGGIDLEATQVVAVAAFLRVINVLDNIRESDEELNLSLRLTRGRLQVQAIRQAIAETEDARQVLEGGGLHTEAIVHLRRADVLMHRAIEERPHREALTRRAIRRLERARDEIVDDGTSLASTLP